MDARDKDTHTDADASYGRLLWRAWNAYLKRASTYQAALLLNLTYLFVLGPSAGLARLSGTRLMDLAHRDAASYWIPRRSEALSLEEMRRQF